MEGEVTDEEFAFGFTFTDEADTLLTEKFAYTGSRTGEVGSGDTLKLKDGESVVFDSVPVGTICTVTEESRARYTTTVNAESINSIRFSVTSESMPIAFVNTLVTTKFTVTRQVLPSACHRRYPQWLASSKSNTCKSLGVPPLTSLVAVRDKLPVAS